MAKETITLKRPVDLRGADGKGAHVSKLELRDMDVGDFLDACKDCREGASRMEQELHVVSICSGVGMSVLRAIKPGDLYQLSNWYDRQWATPTETQEGGEGADVDPSGDSVAR